MEIPEMGSQLKPYVIENEVAASAAWANNITLRGKSVDAHVWWERHIVVIPIREKCQLKLGGKKLN